MPSKMKFLLPPTKKQMKYLRSLVKKGLIPVTDVPNHDGYGASSEPVNKIKGVVK